MRCAAIPFVAAIIFATPAHAVDIWECTWDVTKGHPHTDRYQVSGDELHIAGGNARLRIIQNDEVALIAADSDNWISGANGLPTTAGNLVFIDKKNGGFLETTTILSGKLEGPFISQGICKKVQ